MEKISEDDYMSHSTFKFHKREIADETSSPSKGKDEIGVVAADGGGQ